tara:strand:+ start:282 stop:632 length:351 start_codon:yes stop_codon:yes gene_type:complete
MPVLNHAKRFLVEQLAAKINQMVIGSDGTQATADDGGARALARIVPNVRVLDDQTILVEGRFDTTYSFNASQVQEVLLQHHDVTTGAFIPVYRTDVRAITKSAQNELRITLLIEVN